MDPVSSHPLRSRPSLTLVEPAGDAGRTGSIPGAGDICVFFEPDGTVVRLYGRVDCSMRKEMVEAAFDVVGRGAPVTIDVAPDAEVHPGALTLLEKLVRLPDDVAGPAGAGAVPRPRSGSGGAGPTRRPPGPRLPMARRAPT